MAEPRRQRSRSSGPNRAWAAVTSRVVAATFGGYILTHVASILLVFAVPASRSHAVLAAMMLSFVIYCVAIIWCFATRTAARAWLGMVIPTLVLALPAWWLTGGLTP